LTNSAHARQAAIVDDFGDVFRKVEDFKETAGRYETLRKKILALIADAPADQSCELRGNVWRVRATARSMMRVIDRKNMRKLFDQLGADQFFQNCGFAITKLEHLNIDTAGLLTEERTGSRKLDALPLDPPRRTIRSAAAAKASTVAAE